MKKFQETVFFTLLSIVLFFSCSKDSNEMKLIPVKTGEKWGYINQKGEYVINPQFDKAFPFSEGVALIKLDGKIGYINEDGSYLLSANYKSGTFFSNGLAMVVQEGSAPTCIDKKGNVRFTMTDAKVVGAFFDGMALFVNKDGKIGFIDELGKVVVNPQFSDCDNFYEGLCAVKQEKSSLWGFIDKTGKIVINPQFKYVDKFNNGIAAFSNGKQWGFIDKEGKYVINPQFETVSSLCEGLISVSMGKNTGYADIEGKIVINPQFEAGNDFSNGLACVRQGSRYGFIDKAGKIVINPQFDGATKFFGGVAIVESAGKYGCIDKEGKYVVNPQFDDVEIENRNWYVETDYYDAVTFVTEFMKKSEKNLFDAIDTATTLQSLVSHSKYGDCINDNDRYSAYCKQSQKMDDNVYIDKVYFYFDRQIYSMVPKYEYYWGTQYKVGESKQYDFSSKVNSIQYNFSVSGDAYGHCSALAKALKEGIEKQYGITMEERNGDYYSNKGEYSFLIRYTNYSFGVFVGFGEDSLSSYVSVEDDEY